MRLLFEGPARLSAFEEEELSKFKRELVEKKDDKLLM